MKYSRFNSIILNCQVSNFFDVTGNNATRGKIQEKFEDEDASIQLLVHQNDVIVEQVKFGYGTVVMVTVGSKVSNNLNIISGCEVGAGAVVVKDITESGTYVGVPARKIN